MKRLRYEHNELMRAAWYAGSMQLLKTPPQLADLLIEVDPAQPRARPWQEIKAALLWAMPPKNTTVQ